MLLYIDEELSGWCRIDLDGQAGLRNGDRY